jgi:natural product biosynthesis luciferase-like monooxygenase protein
MSPEPQRIPNRLASLTADQLQELQKSLQSRFTTPRRETKFSLFFFAADSGQPTTQDRRPADAYQLLFEAAQFADQNGFHAIWLPERHMSRFGGCYPSPSILCAALARSTQRIALRAGSVVLPLHNPVLVAEEWAVIDNLSNGRVGAAFASGWVPGDFVLTSNGFKSRKEVMWKGIELITRLWQGQAVSVEASSGQTRVVNVYPRPVQPQLPIWIATTGNPETWERAGAMGANVLTALLQTPLETVAKNIALYRKALSKAGFECHTRDVTLMLHSFIWDNPNEVASIVKPALRAYMRSHLDLYEVLSLAASLHLNASDFGEDDKLALAEYAAEGYFNTRGLFGTPESCINRVREIVSAGVDEIACLIDFGIPNDTVVRSLTATRRLMGLWSSMHGTENVADVVADNSRVLQPTSLDCELVRASTV